MPPCQAGKAARSVIGGFDEPKLAASIILFERLSRDEEWCESKSFSCWEKVSTQGKSSRKTCSMSLIHNLGSPISNLSVWQFCNDWRDVCGDCLKLMIKTQGQHREVLPHGLSSIEVGKTAAPAGTTDVTKGSAADMTCDMRLHSHLWWKYCLYWS